MVNFPVKVSSAKELARLTTAGLRILIEDKDSQSASSYAHQG